MNWPLISLNQICNTQYGYTASADDFEVGPKYLRITDIASGPINWESVPYCKISESDYPKYKLNTGDIVIARTGNTTGYAKLIRNNNNAVFASYLVRIKIKSDLADSNYIGRLIESNIYKNFVRSIKGGAAQGNANATTLTLFKFCLPPIEVQRIITSVLSVYDDLIDTNRRRIQLLEESARLLFREWFVYFRFPGHEKVKIVDGVPEGWEKEHLSTLVTTQYGYTETASQEEIGPKFLRGTDINKTSYIDWASVPYCPNDKLDFRKYSLSQRDILIIRMADPGKVGIVEEEIEAIFASYLIRLKIINKSVSSYFLFYSLLDEKYQGFITGSSTGSTRKSASAKLIVDYNLLIPKKEIIDSFDEQIVPIRKDITILLQQNQKLAQARDLLLPRLMNGTIEV